MSVTEFAESTGASCIAQLCAVDMLAVVLALADCDRSTEQLRKSFEGLRSRGFKIY
jgi:hypothetical protein